MQLNVQCTGRLPPLTKIAQSKNVKSAEIQKPQTSAIAMSSQSCCDPQLAYQASFLRKDSSLPMRTFGKEMYFQLCTNRSYNSPYRVMTDMLQLLSFQVSFQSCAIRYDSHLVPVVRNSLKLNKVKNSVPPKKNHFLSHTSHTSDGYNMWLPDWAAQI